MSPININYENPRALFVGEYTDSDDLSDIEPDQETNKE